MALLKLGYNAKGAGVVENQADADPSNQTTEIALFCLLGVRFFLSDDFPFGNGAIGPVIAN
jgi:hypothetical protein